MTPLRVHAAIHRQIAAPVSGRFALDSMLEWARAQELGLPPVETAEDCRRLEIPVALDPIHGVYLCSFSVGALTEFEIRYITKRPVIEQAQLLGGRGTINITAGEDKAYRIPMSTAHAPDGLTWYCIGDRDELARLLDTHIHYIGRKRSEGLGRVIRWTVEECEPWDGFPVVRDGKPLRPLPVDWPGLVDPPLAYRSLMPPYWDCSKEVLCATPE